MPEEKESTQELEQGVLFHKEGIKQNLKIYRTINLVPVVYNVFTRI